MRQIICSVSTRFSLRHVGLLCVATALAVAIACAGGDNPTAPSATPGAAGAGMGPTSTTTDTPTTMGALGQTMTTICHRHPQTGEFRPLSVPGPAVNGHLAHGDGGVGDPVPGQDGMIFDTDCTPISAAVPILQGGIDLPIVGGQDGGRMIGYDFTPSMDLSLSALGFWDGGSDGLPSAFQVGLWETVSQTLLASATIDNTDPVDGNLIVSGGSWRYETLAGAVALTSGVKYSLGFQVGSSDLIEPDLLLLPNPLTTPLIAFPGVVVDSITRGSTTPSFVFPGTFVINSVFRANVNALVAPTGP